MTNVAEHPSTVDRQRTTNVRDVTYDCFAEILA